MNQKKYQHKKTSSSIDLVRMAVESLPHAFYIIDVQTYQIIYANSATEKFGEITKQSTCYELTHNRNTPCNGKEHDCPLLHVKTSKEPVKAEHVHYDRDGQPHYFEMRAYPIFNEYGDVVHMVEYSLDITDRKEAEMTLKHKRDELEKRVKKRTAKLFSLNEKLMIEIVHHKETELELLQHQEKLKSMASQLTVMEEEQRRQLAIGLHDSVGQSLAALQMKLSEIRDNNRDEAIQDRLNQAFQMLDNIVQETRTLTFELSPPLLYEIGLEAAVEWLAENFQERYNLKTIVKDDAEEKPLNEKIRTILFRIIRELLMNVVKHAKANITTITLARAGHTIAIEIADDGVGIPEISTQGDSFGLFSIRERLANIGGTFRIQSEPGAGTTVQFTAPLQRTHRENIRVI